jgi:predicted RND superfamily exporter protein
MTRFGAFLVRHKRTILMLFIVMSIGAATAMLRVGVNYDLSAYLPQDVKSTKAIAEMKNEFGGDLADAQVMIRASDVAEALEKKHQLQALPFMLDVIWLDDQADVTQPVKMLDQELVSQFFKDGYALYIVTTDREYNAAENMTTLYELIGENGAIAGSLVELGSSQNAIKTEIGRIVMIALPVAFLILLLATDSWLEPVLFLVTILVGILLNFGTNIIFGEVSFITQAVAGVLQMAVTMDYTIYLLHRFREYSLPGVTPEEAMIKAITKSFTAISASALTTLFGFLALVFMRFGIGKDLGFVLAKGVVLSLMTVVTLLPILILMSRKLLDKLIHRPLWPSFRGLGRLSLRIGIPVVIFALIAVYPMFNASRNNHFLYGMGSYPETSRERRDLDKISETFGEAQQFVVLVPRGRVDDQKAYVDDLESLPEIDHVISFTNMVGAGIPEDFVPTKERSLLMSDQYSRIVATADVPAESEETYLLAEQVRAMTEARYGDEAHLAGSLFSMLDMRDTIRKDDLIVNGLAIAAVWLVILLTFKSFILPFLLVFTIEISIWINLAIPYFRGFSLSYIGYLIISTVQLGATVDYAILLTQNYLDDRQQMPKWEAARKTTANTARTVIPPALILASAGFSLNLVSSIPVVNELGLVLGRGALISLAMVLFFLPTALVLCDRWLDKLSFGKKKQERSVSL